MGLLERLAALIGFPRDVPQTRDPTDAPIPQPPIDAPAAAERSYRVKPGDTLPLISREVYGDPALWPRIAEANRERLGDPPVLYPGLTLDLP